MRIRNIIESDIWGDLFNTPPPKVVKIDEPQTIPYTLELYRGFTVDTSALEKRGNKLVLSPKKSEQGLIWFTHKYINGYDPIEYATRGTHMLTYPLECVKHTQRKHYDDGSHYDAVPQEILDVTDPTQNSKFHMGIELPEGWVFSYKMEKFIGCQVELLIEPSMLEES